MGAEGVWWEVICNQLQLIAIRNTKCYCLLTFASYLTRRERNSEYVKHPRNHIDNNGSQVNCLAVSMSNLLIR